MKRVLLAIFGVVCAALLAILAMLPSAVRAEATGGGHNEITICHKGNTITIDESAWPGHKSHVDKNGVKDYKGKCDPNPEPCPTVTVTATATVTQVVETPGPTVTETVQVPGPTVTETVQVPGPTVTVTQVVETPGPETTVTQVVETPGPTVTVTETAPAVTVTATPPTRTVTAEPEPLTCPVPNSTARLAETGAGAITLYGWTILGLTGLGVILLGLSVRRGKHEQ